MASRSDLGSVQHGSYRRIPPGEPEQPKKPRRKGKRAKRQRHGGQPNVEFHYLLRKLKRALDDRQGEPDFDRVRRLENQLDEIVARWERNP